MINTEHKTMESFEKCFETLSCGGSQIGGIRCSQINKAGDEYYFYYHKVDDLKVHYHYYKEN